MRTPSRWLVTALALAALATGCTLAPQDLQAFRLFFELAQDLPTGEQTEVHSAVYPAEAKLRKQFIQIFGRLQPADDAAPPDRIEIEVVLTDLDTEQTYFRHRQTVSLGPDGSFADRKRFRRDIRPNTLQTIFVRPIGADVASGARVELCVELAKKKSNLSADGTCSFDDGAAPAVTVRVVENAFDPKRVRIQPGQTVRWVLTGQMLNHTVTASEGAFDSGFTLDANGAVFERTFGAADDDRTFQYFCRTHQTCCAMQGSVLVGNDAPEPPPDY